MWHKVSNKHRNANPVTKGHVWARQCALLTIETHKGKGIMLLSAINKCDVLFFLLSKGIENKYMRYQIKVAHLNED